MNFQELGNTCVVGLQWGDEGKGKIVDVFMEHFDAVARYCGGANAGHTVVIGQEKFALHQLPSGVLRPNVINIITGGTVLDPAALLGEVQSLRARGVSIGENLRISDRAHLVFPYHRHQDLLDEQVALPAGKLGTTGRGIGPCYADKAARRWGVRVCDLTHPKHLREKVAAVVAYKNAYFSALYDQREPFDAAAIAEEYLALGEQMRPFVCDTTVLLHGLLKQKKRILFEGAQGSLLDIDHGTYPYVTSSSAGVGGVISGTGVPPRALQSVVGVVKAYSTRVGAGPFPTEQKNAIGDTIRERGHEYGTTTGRPRRCGWFDAVAAHYATMLSAASHVAVLHLDTLAGMDEVKICVGYRKGAEFLNGFPADAYTLEEAEPVYETLPGWREDLRGCRRFADLPANAQAYVQAISKRLGAPVSIVGVGPARDQTIFV